MTCIKMSFSSHFKNWYRYFLEIQFWDLRFEISKNISKNAPGKLVFEFPIATAPACKFYINRLHLFNRRNYKLNFLIIDAFRFLVNL